MVAMLLDHVGKVLLPQYPILQIIGRLAFPIFAFMIASNTHLYVIRAVVDSFYVVPIGGAQFEWDSLLLTMTKYMTDLFIIGFRIFLPFFATMMITNCILGIMAKVAPQMNMFSVGIQLKILVGFIVLFFTIFMFTFASYLPL